MLVVVYGVLALAATGRSVLQIPSDFDAGAPGLHALGGGRGRLHPRDWCLARGGQWVRVGTWACTVELVGVLVVGAASYLVPDAFPDKTVWSHFGQGYGFVPLVLPVLGLLWFRKVEPTTAAAERAQAARGPRGRLTRQPSAPDRRAQASTGSSSSTGMSRSVLVW